MSNSTGSHHSNIDKCTRVTPDCKVEYTVLGYYPNLESSYFFAVAFAICLVFAAALGIWKKTWTYTAAIVVGLILETAGYIGRIPLHSNPWNSGAFQLQICTIILAPTFICVSVYLTLKHVALTLNPSRSRIPPIWYPRIFLPADLTCLIIQAIGGGVAAAAGKDKPSLQRDGNRCIIAGIALQVVVLGVFGGLGADYFLRARKHMHSGSASLKELALWRDGKFRKFVYGIGGAYMAVALRCVYRIVEMAGGWANPIMQDEASFLVLDSTLMIITVYLLTIFHPGIFSPQMANGFNKENMASSGVSDAESAGTRTNDATEPKKTKSSH